MVLQGRGRIWRRKDGKYFLYLPKHVVEDSAFPFDIDSSLPVKVAIDRLAKRLLVTPLCKIKAHKEKRD